MKGTLNKYLNHRVILILLLFFFYGCSTVKIKESVVGMGWANNSINTVIFRGDAITTFKDYQFTAYYNPEGKLILAKRHLGSENWELKETSYSGHVKDAHNAISIAVDSEGYLHVSWDHHNSKLNYAKSLQPLGLELTEKLSMTGLQEDDVTYPEFHNLPNGKLLFCYRSGASGRGNMVLNQYDVKTETWTQIQNNLLDGQDQRSAYWQMTIGENGAIYLSWVWRETWDVATNHDICYAVSYDGGFSWKNSKGEPYPLPITENNAEVVWNIPQHSNLINQTSMAVDKYGNPYIASYWNTTTIPQYKVVFLKDETWQLLTTDFHKTPFQLGGGGTKHIPISRPKVFVNHDMIYLLFRDEEQDNKIMLAYTSTEQREWKHLPLTSYGVGQWEPNYDVALWQTQKKLHIFSQHVAQVDGEGMSAVDPQPVTIVELNKIPLYK